MNEKVSKPEDVDSYIANSDQKARPKLEELRELVTSTIPTVEEGINYGVPFYKYHGDLAGFAVYNKHVSFGFGAAVLDANERNTFEEEGYVTGKRTIQIKFDQEVPTTTIKEILRRQARMNEAKSSASSGRGSRLPTPDGGPDHSGG
jgi:uncharacterized protein YdhG (YjbR/CyaY superfamily)